MLFLNQIKEINYAALSVLQGKQWEHVWHRNIGLKEEEKEDGEEVRQGRRQTFPGELQRKTSGDEPRCLSVPQLCSSLPADLEKRGGPVPDVQLSASAWLGP